MFKVGDRVEWRKLDDGGFYEEGRGTVTDTNRQAGALHIKWDDRSDGWAYTDEIKHVDVVTRLGEIGD